MAQAIAYIEPESLKQVQERKRTIVDRTLLEIYEKKGGTLLIDDVIGEAKKPNSPLHTYFDWDDSVAAEKWRRVQAYHLVMQSKIVAQIIDNGQEAPVVKKTQNASVRRLVSAFRGEGFKMRAEAFSDEERRRAIVAKKLSILRTWVAGTVDLVELATIRKAISDVLPPSE